MEKKRKSLKTILLSEIILFVVVLVVVITVISTKMQSSRIESLTKSVLAKESVSYAYEVNSWWSNVEARVLQTAKVIQNTPRLNYGDALNMLLSLTASDPDSQDIYIAYGTTGEFLDGSGWIPDDTFVFTDRAWYVGAIGKNGEIYTSDPYVDASTGKTCLACSVLLRDKVVLSSDINFDKVTERLKGFTSVSKDASFYIINTASKDILVSNSAELVGQKVDAASDPVIQGLNKVFGSLKTDTVSGAEKVLTASTSKGKMMLYTATEIAGTSWVVVSAVPYSFISKSVWNTVLITILITAVLLAALGALLYYIISKYLSPVSVVTERISDISRGNFNVRLDPVGNNEITTLAERLNEYIGSMRQTLSDLADISNNMNESAGECLNITQTLSDANQTQNGSIEQLNGTLTSMNESIDEIARAATELAATSGQLSQNADDVKNLCNVTLESSTTGKAEMSNMTANVKTLNDTIRELTDIIRTTARSIDEITGITDTINAISSQTNLLSLNASIEAARAGEMGKGFAVVATEVGALAKQSSEATENIRTLIGTITVNIEEINKKADTCVADMEICMEGMEKANQSFRSIYDDVAKATDGILEIAEGIERINDVASNNAATTQEQASTINEIMNLSEQIVTESNKVMTETDSISNVSENLNRYSDIMKTDLSKYTL